MIDPLAPSRPTDTRPALLGGAALLVIILLWALRDLVVLAGISVLLAYALDPVVTALGPIKPGGRGIPRGIAAAIVMLVMVMFAGFALAWLLPQAVGELVKFLERAPAIATDILNRFREWATTNGFATYVDPITEMVRTNLAAMSENAAGIIAAAFGRVFSSLGALLGVAVLPLLSFYLLAEREEVKHSAFRFIPPVLHVRVRGAAGAIDRALRSYVRGQAIVCLVMGTSVGVALTLMRFPYALFLGALVGIAEIVPYLGFLLAATAIVLTGFTLGPLQAVLGLGLYTLINNLVGMLITPRVMGRYLEMHPYVVTLSVLAGAKLLGPGGVLLALPLAAIVQSMISEFAQRSPDEIIVPHS
jgi:predicted PurR-regulated permease PerM